MHDSDAPLLESTVGDWLRFERDEAGPKPTACGTPLRSSMAMKCERAVALDVAGVPGTAELGTTTLIAFRVGTSMHEFCQEAMAHAFPDLEAEALVDLRPMGFEVSGAADWLFTHGEINGRPRRLVGELKTMGAFAFKLSRNEDAPKIEHIAQAAMYAIGLEADGVQMCYISKESGSWKDNIKPGQILEWIYEMDDIVHGQSVYDIGMTELMRLQGIWELIQDGTVPPRHIPGHGFVDSVPRVGSSDKPWNCRYCDHNEVCSTMGVDAVPIWYAPDYVKDNWKPPVV